MAKDRDYGRFDDAKADNSHYSMPSFYGKIVREQYNEQPKYCWPGEIGADMKGSKSNEQVGP
jgi:hypothetical protein